MKFETAEADIEFKNQMESCEFPAPNFDHRVHLRLAYIYVSKNNTDKSAELMRDTLNRFLFHNGVDPSKYHETLTKGWILAVHHFMSKTGDSSSADEFIDRNPEMLDTKIRMTHYSAEVFFSGEAGRHLFNPILIQFPGMENERLTSAYI